MRQLGRPNLERLADQHRRALETDEVPWPPQDRSGYRSYAHEVFYEARAVIDYALSLELDLKECRKLHAELYKLEMKRTQGAA